MGTNKEEVEADDNEPKPNIKKGCLDIKGELASMTFCDDVASRLICP